MDFNQVDAQKVEDKFQAHLDKVSRSFAVCIAKLDMPFRKWVGLSYLLCRVLDTVEDSKWSNERQRDEAFKGLDEFVSWSAPAGQEQRRWERMVSEIEKWSQSFPDLISEGERGLVKDSPNLFYELHFAPIGIRKIIQELLKTMSEGMKHFAKLRTADSRGAQRDRDSKNLVLKNMDEVNQYCFFVAGIVGEALTKILAETRPNFHFWQDAIPDAHSFGLFLQKINLLKDQLKDEGEGRYLVPNREEMILSMKQDADKAFRYIQNIPMEHYDYRIFCLWSFFLGLKTLPLLMRPLGDISDYKNKVDRKDMSFLFDEIETLAKNPMALEDLYIELSSPVRA